MIIVYMYIYMYFPYSKWSWLKSNIDEKYWTLVGLPVGSYFKFAKQLELFTEYTKAGKQVRSWDRT